MAGYSSTPLAKKLGIATESRVALVRAPAGLAAGLVDNKICAIDEVWSGLRFVIRLRDRKRGRQP